MVEVTQADRDAVQAFQHASFTAIYSNGGDKQTMGKGLNTAHNLLLQAFAAHREAAYEAGLKAGAEALRLVQEQLTEAMRPQWFYHPDYTERCEFGPWDVIEAYDLEPGRHVVEIQTARPLPSIWSVVHVLTDKEKDALDTDEAWVVQDFSTEAEARAAFTAIERGEHLETDDDT